MVGLDSKPLQVPGGRALSQQQVVGAVLNSLYRRADWTPLLQALTTASHGDGQALLKLADEGNHRNPDCSYGQINDAFPAVRCLDSRASSVRAAERSAEREAKKAPILGPLSGPDLICPLWPVAPAPKEPRITAKGAAPILVLGTTGDPATPTRRGCEPAKASCNITTRAVQSRSYPRPRLSRHGVQWRIACSLL